MIAEELKKEIISMWEKGSNISQISREKKVSRPTVRKIVEEYKKNRKWWLVRTYMEDEFVRLIINTSYRRAEKEDEIKRLASGVEHWELNRLIQKILKPETADEVMDNFMRDPPRISILYVKRTEINKGIGYIE